LRRPVVAVITAALAFAGVTAAAAPASAAVSTEYDFAAALMTAVDGDTIELAADITLTADIPLVAADIVIDGGGHTIDGTGVFSTFRVDANRTVTIRDVVVANSAGDGVYLSDDAPGDGDISLTLDRVVITGSGDDGVFARLSGSLTVIDSRIEANRGDGIEAELHGGTLTVTDAVISENDGHGMLVTGADGTVAVTGSTLNANGEPSHEWDGILLLGVTDFTVELSDTTTNDNNRHGVRIDGANVDATVTRLTSNHNGYPDFGDGLVFETRGADTLTLTDSEFAENIEVGVFINNRPAAPGDIRVERVTSADNARMGMVALLGDGTTFDLVNSTITGNGYAPSVDRVVGFLADNQAGGAAVTLRNTTIAGNMRNNDFWPTIGLVGANGATRVPTTWTMSHMVVSGNRAGAADDGGEIDAAFDYDLTVDHSYIGSLVSSVDAPVAAAIAAGTGNITGDDPQLGPLAANGGFGRTMLPLAGSPLLDAGVATLAVPTTDQRGLARVSGAAADLGAVEVQATQPQLAATGSAPLLPLGLAVLALLGGVVALATRRRARA
jgi:hypothetical protein